ncbi:MAG: helix-turn-helix transcriptional regulator [Clostridia bacterium]|nr:helix-turn-helix transcriptional regulator [Clostridia bacterium]MBQ8470075.1 helix-turn-helix transcriptional regulator [Clostridia bacterium]MBR1704641.1 helix-turn-helix transcriptional regulator [Clostridia bacterium]
MSESGMTVGDRIRSLRKREGISQTDLAQKMGVIKQTLYKYETGIVTNIPSEKIEAAARALGVTPGYLMGWEDQDAESFSYVRHRAINDMLDKLTPSEVEMVEGIIRQIVNHKSKD